VPGISGQVRNADLTIIQHGGRCPDVSGPASALRKGRETKKDMSMLFSWFGFLGGTYFVTEFRGRQ
jgi:hypothetical protein